MDAEDVIGTQVSEANVDDGDIRRSQHANSDNINRGPPVTTVPPPQPLGAYLETPSDAHEPSHRDRVWTFLTQAKKEPLRNMCKEMNACQRVNKPDLALNLFR